MGKYNAGYEHAPWARWIQWVRWAYRSTSSGFIFLAAGRRPQESYTEMIARTIPCTFQKTDRIASPSRRAQQERDDTTTLSSPWPRLLPYGWIFWRRLRVRSCLSVPFVVGAAHALQSHPPPFSSFPWWWYSWLLGIDFSGQKVIVFYLPCFIKNLTNFKLYYQIKTSSYTKIAESTKHNQNTVFLSDCQRMYLTTSDFHFSQEAKILPENLSTDYLTLCDPN